ncbi:MAG TPA: dienelactone hydrolase family protein [Caldimonas sp.]
MTAPIGRARPGRAALLALAILGAGAGAAAAPAAFRVEVHALPTVTMTRAQVLAGKPEGAAAATIAGELRLPLVAAARMPAVLMLHGDAGAIANQVVWTEELNAIGIAVLTLDSFSGRAAVATGASLATMPASIDSLARVVDAERALALLSRHPRIDPARIAVMGFSSGGKTALLAAQTRFASTFGAPGIGFAAYIALYPDCNTRFLDETRSEPGPQRIFIGEADVLTAADACVRYVDRLRRAGTDIAIATYPDAHHGFDNVAAAQLVRIPDVELAARCNFEETKDGAIVNVDTGRELADGDKCITRGLVAGYDAGADAATKAAVKSLLIERFGLKR